MKCCNPRCCANWIYTTCHSSTFTSCSTSPCHTCNLAVLLYLASPPVSPPFPAPCIFAYFIIYGTMAHGSNSANSNSARKPISRSATIYGQTRSTLSSLLPLSLSHFLLLLFFFLSHRLPRLFLIIPFDPVTLTSPFICPLLAVLPVRSSEGR